MPGTVLLLAASPVGRGCLVDAASVLPVLAAVPPAVLSGTDTANVVELADPLEPQAVLTRLRAAAAAPAPLTVFITGQLHLDRRQHLPHLALARSTPSTVRYTGFPWHWFREELRLRAPGSTALLVDLHADAETWEWLCANPLDSGRGSAVYGRIAPPPNRRTVAGPAYMKAVATLLRSGHRPPLDHLHQQALTRISPDSGPGTDIILTAQTPTQPPTPTSAPGGLLAPAATPLPTSAPASAATAAPADGRASAPLPATSALPGRAPGSGVTSAATAVPAPAPVSAPTPTTAAVPTSAPTPTTTTSPDPAPTPATSASPTPAPSNPPSPTPPPVPSNPPTLVLTPLPSTPPTPEPTVPPGPKRSPALDPAQSPAPSSTQPPPPNSPRPTPTPDDPHDAITTAVQAGRHDDADELAAREERRAVQVYGPGSSEGLHWSEVRADLAMLAGDPGRSCRAWLSVASARLTAGQAPDAPAVEDAVDRAHHQWGQIRDTALARELGSALAELRSKVPGRRRGALENVHQRLEQLQVSSG